MCIATVRVLLLQKYALMQALKSKFFSNQRSHHILCRYLVCVPSETYLHLDGHHRAQSTSLDKQLRNLHDVGYRTFLIWSPQHQNVNDLLGSSLKKVTTDTPYVNHILICNIQRHGIYQLIGESTTFTPGAADKTNDGCAVEARRAPSRHMTHAKRRTQTFGYAWFNAVMLGLRSYSWQRRM